MNTKNKEFNLAPLAYINKSSLTDSSYFWEGEWEENWTIKDVTNQMKFELKEYHQLNPDEIITHETIKELINDKVFDSKFYRSLMHLFTTDEPSDFKNQTNVENGIRDGLSLDEALIHELGAIVLSNNEEESQEISKIYKAFPFLEPDTNKKTVFEGNSFDYFITSEFLSAFECQPKYVNFNKNYIDNVETYKNCFVDIVDLSSDLINVWNKPIPTNNQSFPILQNNNEKLFECAQVAYSEYLDIADESEPDDSEHINYIRYFSTEKYIALLFENNEIEKWTTKAIKQLRLNSKSLHELSDLDNSKVDSVIKRKIGM